MTSGRTALVTPFDYRLDGLHGTLEDRLDPAIGEVFYDSRALGPDVEKPPHRLKRYTESFHSPGRRW